ncbi:STT3 domain-containing protein [Megalodesulfovibrio gigas]|uniref:Oligosaccharyl transferase STT3 subunit n=1 Tax=Megalodesulfovibrio gigas (strain ATCC 19364 / DSM 1382 / NCIMB 9332 / VKM B-1759) TaxID=1121448 RepID=T2GBX6_MEGG1|nr:STT3 domain-containing protein [Megalodesulfovibrio gigas]AGW14065.1 hypothetical protein DGI_2311 [Megalodesulfovibrio gigas DSM 1382 = ATCC 19364]
MSAPWNAVAPEQPARQELKLFLFVLGFTYALALAVHMHEIYGWQNPALVVDGEFIQGTHDSYHWLAGAKGVGEAVGTPLAVMAAGFASLTGMPLGLAGFVIPPLFAGLVGLVMAVWCRVLGWKEGAAAGGLVAGLLTVLSPGFYFRSRLGYYDTDMVTLLFPLLFTLGLAMAMGRWIRPSWRHREPLQEEPPQTIARVLAWLVLLGLLARFGAVWHGHILTFVKVLCGFSVCWGLAAGRPGARGRLMLGLAVFMASALVGWPGLACSLALWALAWKKPEMVSQWARAPWPGLAALVLLAVLGGVAQTTLQSATELLGAYLKPAADVTGSVNTTGVIYPGIGQSVIEVQNIALERVLERFHTSWLVAATGLLCFLGVLVLRPVALPLAIFLVMGLASVKLGSRLTMFGGAPMAIGLGMAVGWAGVALFRSGPGAGYKRFLLSCAATVVLGWPLVSFYISLPPTPVLSRQHCMALQSLKTSPPESKVWTWWDWGYPTHYYAERISFADGGRHYGHHIFPLGLVLTTPNPRLSAQLIKYSAQWNDEPWKAWDAMPRNEMLALLQGLGNATQPLPPFAAPRYVVATFENIRLAPWITYYGTWDMTTQQGLHGRLLEIRDAFRINYEKGEVQFTQREGVLPVASIDVLDRKERRSDVFPRNQGPHLVVHMAAQKYYLLDDQIYNSMMVQLLLEDPKKPRFGDYFSLVYDDFPDVRVFEVR